jgi:hypothetical protein
MAKIIALLATFLLVDPTQGFNLPFGAGIAKAGLQTPMRLSSRVSRYGALSSLKSMSELEPMWDRRAALAHLSISQLALMLTISQSNRVSAGSVYQAVADEIQAAVKKTPDFGPTLVRLAWHSR